MSCDACAFHTSKPSKLVIKWQTWLRAGWNFSRINGASPQLLMFWEQGSCNRLCVGLPLKTLQKPQLVNNAACSLLVASSMGEHRCTSQCSDFPSTHVNMRGTVGYSGTSSGKGKKRCYNLIGDMETKLWKTHWIPRCCGKSGHQYWHLIIYLYSFSASSSDQTSHSELFDSYHFLLPFSLDWHSLFIPISSPFTEMTQQWSCLVYLAQAGWACIASSWLKQTFTELYFIKFLGRHIHSNMNLIAFVTYVYRITKQSSLRTISFLW